MIAEATFRDRAVYLPRADALVAADLHVGRDATSNVEFPLGERSDLCDRLAALLDRFDPATVVLAGDVLHAFDRVPDAAGRTLADLVRAAADRGATAVAVRGNHDTMLDEVFDGRVADAVLLDDATAVVHGHEAPADAAGDAVACTAAGTVAACEDPAAVASAGRYVAGHDHPAIRIEGDKHPCFLYGPGVYRGSDVLLLPAFNRLARGGVVNGMAGRDFETPLVEAGAVGALRPVVHDGAADETFAFPPLSTFRELL